MTPQEFAERMQRELDANANKGNWSEWKPTRSNAMKELDHHCSKLSGALLLGSTAQITEFAADVANIAMENCRAIWGYHSMTTEEIVEAMAESAHDSWHQAYKDLGYTSRQAAWGEEFMVPYSQLSERGKEFDRVIMRAILKAFATQGLAVVPSRETTMTD